MSDRMQFWPYYPEKFLLSDKVRLMPLIAVAGYRFLCDHAMLETLPGILPIDDQKLRGYARMNVREWDRYRVAILANFMSLSKKEGSGVSEWLGQHFVMQLYRDFKRRQHDLSYAGRRAVYARKDRNRDSESIQRPYTDPYGAFTNKISKELITVPSPFVTDDGLDGTDGEDDEPLADVLRRAMKPKPIREVIP